MLVRASEGYLSFPMGPAATTIMNFSAGPAMLPPSVMDRVAAELRDYRGTRMSVLEMSHRSVEFEEIIRGTEATLRRLLDLGDDWSILFLQGGASLQFSQVPMNFLEDSLPPAAYAITGEWGRKALAAARIIGEADAIWDGGPEYRSTPHSLEIEEAAYLHVTTNETIHGPQYPQEIWSSDHVPTIADASSDFLSRPIEVSRYAMIYAGAQKNLGPAGLTLALIRRDLLDRGRAISPMLDYRTHDKAGSLYNTPPCFSIWVTGMVLEWIEAQGLTGLGEANTAKADLVYNALDASPELYSVHPEPRSRSLMNVVFRLRTPELEAQLLLEGREKGMVELKGHRSIGGLRASLYNAVPTSHAQALADLLGDFARRHG